MALSLQSVRRFKLRWPGPPHASAMAARSLILFAPVVLLGWGHRLLAQQSTPAASPVAAKQALDNGQYAEAEGIYRRLLVATPDSPVLLSNLGIALDLQGKSLEAAEILQRSLRLKKDAKTYTFLAKQRCDLNDFAEARPMLETIVKEDAARPELLRIIAPCFLRSGDPVDAVDVNRRLSLDPQFSSDLVFVDLTRAYLASAQFFYRQLNHAPDKDDYVKALQAARSDQAAGARGAFPLAASRSKLFQEGATYREAIAAWRTSPSDSALLYQLCVLSGEGSLATLAELRRQYPSSPFAGQMVAEILADQGLLDEAKVQYEELMKINPELPGLRDDLGMLLIQQQDWAAALAVFQEQVKNHPSDQQAIAHLSQSLLELGRFVDLKAFLVPRSNSPDAPLWLRLDLATAFQQLDDPTAAISQLVLAEKRFPSDKSVHYRLLRLYKLTGAVDASAREKQLFEEAK